MKKIIFTVCCIGLSVSQVEAQTSQTCGTDETCSIQLNALQNDLQQIAFGPENGNNCPSTCTPPNTCDTPCVVLNNILSQLQPTMSVTQFQTLVGLSCLQYEPIYGLPNVSCPPNNAKVGKTLSKTQVVQQIPKQKLPTKRQ
jgi:hypothetical protein